VTKADKTIDLADPDYTPLNDVDAKNWEACGFLGVVRCLVR
jgi:amidase